MTLFIKRYRHSPQEMKMTNTVISKKFVATTAETSSAPAKPFYVPSDLIDFGFSKSFVYGGVKSGDIPSKRIGAKIIIDHAWVKETFDLDAA